jgi:hypothetical protein
VAREPIRGKVARILSSRELVINRGSSNGVKVGMRFAVLDSSGENVTDPDTGEVLGSVTRTKVEVEAVQVESHLAVARTFRYREVNVGGNPALAAAGQISQMFAPPRYVKRYDTLKLSDADWEPLSEQDSFIEVGDAVIEVAGPESDQPTAGFVTDAPAE